jgi:Ca-activated chloride channel family protein
MTTTGYQFASPWWLALLVLLPVLFLLRGRPGRRPGLAFGSLHLIAPLAKPARMTRFSPRWLLLLPAFVLATIAMARPQKVEVQKEREFSGIEILVALDVSRSMTAEDFELAGQQVDRLTAARAVCKEFIEGRPNDRIGAIAFAGRPYPVSVPTMKHDWILNSIDRVRIGLVEDGTAIGSAIAAAASKLDKQKSKSKIIVLITDGKSNAGQLDPIEAARQAAALGIRIYAITVGRPGQSVIRVPDEFGNEMLARIVNEYDPETMRRLAELTGGQSYQAEGTGSLRDAFQAIDKLEKSTLAHKSTVRREDLFRWFLIPAALLALWEVFRPTREERALPA